MKKLAIIFSLLAISVYAQTGSPQRDGIRVTNPDEVSIDSINRIPVMYENGQIKDWVHKDSLVINVDLSDYYTKEETGMIISDSLAQINLTEYLTKDQTRQEISDSISGLKSSLYIERFEFDTSNDEQEFELGFTPTQIERVTITNSDIFEDDLEFSITGNVLKILSTLKENDIIRIWYWHGANNTTSFSKSESDGRYYLKTAGENLEKSIISIADGTGGKAYPNLTEALAVDPLPDDNVVFSIDENNELEKGVYAYDSSKPEGYRLVRYLDSEALVVLYTGQSNAAGRVPIATANPDELAVKNNILIWNMITQSFQPLDIPVNNESGFNQYGSEIVFSRKCAELYPNKTIYLIKYAVGNTRIIYWKEGGDGRVIYEKAYLRPAIYNILSRHEKVNLVKFFMQGEADNSSTYGGSVYLENLRDWVEEWREELGEVPIVLGEIGSSTFNINANMHTVANENSFISVVPMQGKPMLDAVHFNRESILYLGEKQFDLLPNREGERLLKNLPLINHYLIRNITGTEIDSGRFNMNIDCEWASIIDGDTNILIDGEVVESEELRNFGTGIITINDLEADGLEHSIRLQNSISGEYYELNFTYPSALDEKSITLDFSGYSVPTTDDTKFEELTGTYEINTSPTTDKAFHLTSISGGVSNDIGAIKIKNLEDVQSFTMDFDYLTTNGSITQVYGGVMFRLNVDGSTRIRSYRLKIRTTSVNLMVNNGQGDATLVTATVPTQSINTWRRYRLSVDGYRIIVSYSTDGGSTWTEALNYLQTRGLNFGLDTSSSYYPKGEIAITSQGATYQGAWFKNIVINN